MLCEKNTDWQRQYALDAGYMFVPRCLLQTPSLPKSAAIIYAAIVVDDMDGDGVIAVKIARLAKKTGYTERLIGHVIGLLIDADLPEPEPDRKGRANIYRLMTRIIPLKRNAIAKSPQNGG